MMIGDPTISSKHDLTDPALRESSTTLSRVKVVIGTDYEYRKAWYLRELADAGLNVVASANGIACVEAIHAQMPDVVILEIDRYHDDAQQVLHACRSVRLFQNIPVVLIARFGVGGKSYQLSSFPIQGFFSRMPSVAELVLCVTRLCRSKIDPGASK